MTVKFDRDAGVRGNRRALTTWVVMGLIAAIFVIAIPSGATGALPNPPLFELDGNATTDHATPGVPDDWDRIYCAQTGVTCATNPGAPSALSSSFLHEPAGMDISYFKGGAKDADATPQGCGANAASKDELNDIFAAAYTDPANNHTILYFGGDRASVNGDSDIGFWLNGPGTAASPGLGTTSCPGGGVGFTGTHQNGDLLVLSTFTNGGGVSSVQIFQWQNGALNTTPISTDAACTTPTSATAVACAIANSATITTPWPFGSTTPPGSVPSPSFFEGGVDLTQLLAPAPGAVTPCFDTFYGETRSSQSLTATLMDFGFGDVSTCGSVELTKVWNGTPGSTTLGIGTTANGTDIASKTVTTNDTTGAHLVNPGTYHVSETIKDSSVSGQYSTSLSCMNTKNGGSTPFTPTPDVVGTGQSAGFPVKTGDIDVCTYTNTLNNPKIAITKVADATSVSAGDPIGFTVNVSNPGTTVTNGVTVTDPLPAGVTWSLDTQSNAGLCSLSGAVGSQSITCGNSSTPLAAGASFSFHVTATTSSSACATYNNTATVNTTNTPPASATASITCHTASIQVLKTADAASVNAGDPIGYTVTVKNNGTGTAKGVTLTDALPAGSGTGVTWAIDGSTGNPAAFTLAGAKGSQTLTLAGQPITLAANGSLVVHITALTSAAECTTYNNTATVATTNDGTSTASALITCHPAVIQVLKTADAAVVDAGDPIGYTVTVKNTGSGLAKGVVLTDALPAGSGTKVTWAIDSSTGNPAAFAIAGATGSQTLTLAGQPITLAAGTSLVVHITALTSSAECSTYNNSATVTTTNDGTSTANATITCHTASIQVLKTADAASVNAGDPIGYTVTVKNNGTGTAKGVTLTDALPAGSGSGVTWAIDGSTGNPAAFTLAGAKGSQTLTLAGQPITLGAGASLTVHITAQTSGAECSTYSNTASVTTTNDGTSNQTAVITCNPALIQVLKTADASPVNAGDPIGFTVTVKNNGTGLAKGVSLTDALPAGSGTGTGVTWAIDNSTGNPAAFSVSGAKGSQTLTLAGQPITLAAGASLVVHITALTSGSECTVYNNTATVTTTNDGTSTANASITCNPASIQVTKTADAASVNAGDTIGYTVTVKNNGTGTAKGVTLTDLLPAGSGSGVTWSVDGSTGNPAAFTLAGAKGSQTLTLAGQPITLGAGASLTVHITALTSGTECSTYSNTASVTTTNDGTSNQTAVITCNPASIQVLKTADASPVNAGDPIGFTVTVKNNGTGLAKGVSLTDALPAGTGTGTGVTWAIDGATGNPAAFSVTGAKGSQTLTLAGQPITLAAGASLVVHITALTSGTECTSYNNTATVTTTNDGSSTANASITCNPASIQVLKTADAASVNDGDTIGFTVTVKNNGTGLAKGVTLNDLLPAGTGTGVTWAKDGSVGNPAAFTLGGVAGSQTLTLAGQPITLAAGGILTVHITATTSLTECSTYNNTAAVTTTNDGTSSALAQIVCNSGAIQVIKTADASPVNAGDPIGFTVTVKNNGTGLAHGVTLTDSLPAGSGSGVTWAIDGATGNPAAFTLAGAKGSQTLTLAGQPITLGAGASLVVHITAQTSGAECSTYNNTASVTTTNAGTSMSSAQIVCNPASIQVLKTADAASVNAGDTIGYTVTVKNNGTGLAKGVTLTDLLPAGTGSGVTWAVDGSTGNPAAFTLAGVKGSQTLTLAGQPITLGAGASLSVHITALTSGTECSTYSNTAAVTTTNDGTSNQTAVITCNPASIQVLKTADASPVNAGDPIGFTVTVKNNGTGLAKGVTLTDALPAGSGTGVTWAIDGSTGNPAAFTVAGSAGSQTLTLVGQPITLAAGASLVVHITALTSGTECTAYNNTATVTTTNDGMSTANASITCNPASIQVTKTADAASVNAGDTIGYTVTVKNNGTGLAKGVSLNDSLPAGTGSGVTWAIDGSVGNPAAFTLGGVKGSQTLTLAGQPITLGAGASLTVHITAQTSGTECSTYSNTASVTTTNDGTSNQTAVITCNPASIQVLKTADASPVNAGDPIGFTVTVKNNGTGLAKGVTLTDALPAGTGSGVTWAIDGSTGNPAAFTVAGATGSQTLTLAGQPITLAAGASLVVHITALTSGTECTAYNNTATVTTTNDGTSTANASITCNPASIQVLKTADAASVNAGDTIGYTVTVKNNGTGTAKGVSLNDALPAGSGSGVTWAIDGSTGTPAAFTLAGAKGSQTLTLAGQPITLAAGASLVVHITALTSGTECSTYSNTASVTTTNDGTSSQTAVITCNPASIQVLKTADAASVNSGDTIGLHGHRQEQRHRPREGRHPHRRAPCRNRYRCDVGDRRRDGQPGCVHCCRRQGQPDADPRGPADHAGCGCEPRGAHHRADLGHGVHDLQQLGDRHHDERRHEHGECVDHLQPGFDPGAQDRGCRVGECR